ncbi:MAG: phosphotransferase [Actinomycetota bacterium]
MGGLSESTGRVVVDRIAAEEWIRSSIARAGRIETEHEEPWATVLRIPIADGAAWFKACAPVQAFEPRHTAKLFERWPDRLPEVVAYDEDRAWLLLADAGTSLDAFGNPPEAWLQILPRYAELQRGEVSHVDDHLAHGVPDRRLAQLPAGYQALLQLDLPLERHEVDHLRKFRPHFAEQCRELAAAGVPESVQHDDLHCWNLYRHETRLRILDWGDASISHPFASLVVTFRFLEEITMLPAGDPWFARLRDAYLEPWGRGLIDVFDLAYRVGSFARAIAYIPVRAAMPKQALAEFDTDLAVVLRRAIAQIRA